MTRHLWTLPSILQSSGRTLATTVVSFTQACRGGAPQSALFARGVTAGGMIEEKGLMSSREMIGDLLTSEAEGGVAFAFFAEVL